MEECTFKPRFINKAVMNKNLASKKARNYQSISHSVMLMPQPRHEELFMSAKEKEYKLKKMRIEKEKKEKNDLNFNPTISKKSRQMVAKRMNQCSMQSSQAIKKS